MILKNHRWASSRKSDKYSQEGWLNTHYCSLRTILSVFWDEESPIVLAQRATHVILISITLLPAIAFNIPPFLVKVVRSIIPIRWSAASRRRLRWRTLEINKILHRGYPDKLWYHSFPSAVACFLFFFESSKERMTLSFSASIVSCTTVRRGSRIHSSARVFASEV